MSDLRVKVGDEVLYRGVAAWGRTELVMWVDGLNFAQRAFLLQTLAASLTEGRASDELLTIRQTAVLLGVCVATVRNLHKSGRLVGVNIGVGTKRANWRFARRDVDGLRTERAA